MTIRNNSITVWLTDAEAARLHQMSHDTDMSQERVIVNALRAYDAIHSGDAELVHKNAPVGLPGFEG